MPESIQARVNDVHRWSQTLPDEYLMCRDMGHLWRPLGAKINPSERTYERTLRCGRCRTERAQTLSASGLILAGHYSYADGYAAPAGTGRLDGAARGELRLESVLRVLTQDEGPN